MPAIVSPSITEALVRLAVNEGEIIDKYGHLEIEQNPGATLDLPSDAANAVHRVIIGLANGKWSGPDGPWGDYLTRATNRGGSRVQSPSSRRRFLETAIKNASDRVSRRRWNMATHVAAMPSMPQGAAQIVAEFLVTADEESLAHLKDELTKLEEVESSKAIATAPSSQTKSNGVTTSASKVKEELAAIRVERERQEEARQRKEAAAREVTRRSQETKRTLELAAYGIHSHLQAQGIVHTQFEPDREPVGAIQERITISSRAWAKRICDAARAFAQTPGLHVLDERPIRDVGVGIDMGKKIFLLAANGESDEVIAQLIDEARASLGPWREGQGRPLADSELGIWAYLRDLDRFYDNGEWRPPAHRIRQDLASEDECEPYDDSEELGSVATTYDAVGAGHSLPQTDSQSREDSSLLAVHSDDFTSVRWFGRAFIFTKMQAAAMRLLWDHWERGNLAVSEETIGERIGSSSERFRIRDLFQSSRDGIHPAFEIMIESAGKGTFRLKSPRPQENPQ